MAVVVRDFLYEMFCCAKSKNQQQLHSPVPPSKCAAGPMLPMSRHLVASKPAIYNGSSDVKKRKR